MSIEAELVYPDTRDALYELIDQGTFAGYHVDAFYQLPVDYATRQNEGTNKPTATVLIYSTGGTEGWIDRVDRATVEVYAPGPDSVRVAEAIRSHLAGDQSLWGTEGKPHDLDAGYIDGIRCETTPHDVPHAAETVNLARAGYLVTSRPI